MELTKEIIKEKYDEYNNLYFNGKLGKCVFGLLPESLTYLGMFSTRKARNGNLIGWIRLGRCVEWNEELMKGVLIHEMVHMHNRLVEKGLASTWPFNGLFSHGFFFKRQCRRIRREYGLKVPVKMPVFKHMPYKNKKHAPSFAERVLSRLLGC